MAELKMEKRYLMYLKLKSDYHRLNISTMFTVLQSTNKGKILLLAHMLF